MPAGARYVLVGAHLEEADASVDGVTPLPAGDLFISGVALPERSSLADREVVARVAALRQELIGREIFVAIRYGATARDASAAAGKCAPHLGRWRALLQAGRGRVELVMRIGGENAAGRPDREAFASGADYLRALHAMRHAVPVDDAFVTEAESRFRGIAEAVKRIAREDGTIEIASLLPRDRIDAARSIAEELKRTRAGVPFLLSGPWPLEVFADET